MKTQSLFFEYILLILLSIFAFSYIYAWFSQNKDYFYDLTDQKKFEEKIKIVDAIMYNFISFKTARETFEIDYKVKCLGNYTIILTPYGCKTNPKILSFNGYVIFVNYTYYIYSNNTNAYYPATPFGYFILKSCYENKLAYLINTTECYKYCPVNCNLVIEKVNNKYIAR